MKKRISLWNQRAFLKIALWRLKTMTKLGLIQAPVARLLGTHHLDINGNVYAIQEFIMEHRRPNQAVPAVFFRYTTGECDSPVIDSPFQLSREAVTQTFAVYFK